MKQNVVYVSQVEEFEAGWGSRPDGYLVADTKEALEMAILEIENKGSYEYFCRCGEPFIQVAKDEFYAKLTQEQPHYVWLSVSQFKANF